MRVLLWLVILGICCTAACAMDSTAAEKLMRSQLGSKFVYCRSEMFVCAGNMDKASCTAIVDGTVTAGAQALWKHYFVKRPAYAIRVYLFSEERTYRFYAKQLFGDNNVSYFGYYKPDEKALVMNIGTGTGTLMHEMVHALMEPDFSTAPTWFSEGLASLYEQCRFEHGAPVGLVNWRLPVLKEGMQKGTTLPLARLVSTKRAEFLNEHMGVHYAQARYFCMFMQERGVLTEFYKTFRDGYARDNSGAATLERVFHQPMADIEKAWLAWVETLSPEKH